MTITESNNKTNMKEPIFKPGDRIYHPFLGWAVVKKHNGNVYQIVYESKTGTIEPPSWVNKDYVEMMFSFTEYDPIKGGLSHERPLPVFKMGDIVKHTTNEMYILVTSLSIFNSKSFSGVVIKGLTIGYFGSGWNKDEYILTDKKIDLI